MRGEAEPSARWAVGATVVVRTLGRKQGVIEEAGARGRYRVRVGGIATWCHEEDLAPVEAPKKARKRAHGDPGHRADTSRDELHAQTVEAGGRDNGGTNRQGVARARLDLHGFRVDEALVRVDDAISQALLRGADEIEIVHGRGTGRIRDALHRHLGSMSVVATFRLDPRNPGVTRVHFSTPRTR